METNTYVVQKPTRLNGRPRAPGDVVELTPRAAKYGLLNGTLLSEADQKARERASKTSTKGKGD